MAEAVRHQRAARMGKSETRVRVEKVKLTGTEIKADGQLSIAETMKLLLIRRRYQQQNRTG